MPPKVGICRIENMSTDLKKRSKKTKSHKKTEYETIDNFLPDRVDRNDPRYIEAVRFYDETRDGTHVIKLYKTTRAGATVSLSAESVNRNDLLTLICRTNKVITQTMKGDVVDHRLLFLCHPPPPLYI